MYYREITTKLGHKITAKRRSFNCAVLPMVFDWVTAFVTLLSRACGRCGFSLSIPAFFSRLTGSILSQKCEISKQCLTNLFKHAIL
jgi:hypothetical protein